jgi:hypothetical protein
MTTEEWQELDMLRRAISFNPATVTPEKQERFTELLVLSLKGKGDQSLHAEARRYISSS